MFDDPDSDLIPGYRVRVRTTHGWEITGELQLSDADVIRVFDAAINEVMRLAHEDVAEVEMVDDTSSS